MKMSNKVKMGQESNPIGGLFLKYDEQGLKSVRRFADTRMTAN